MKRRKIFAATAIGATAALLISACSSSGSSSSGSSSTPNSTTGTAAFNAGVSGVVAASTHKGGTLTFDNSSTPDSFDPGNTY
jgi:peptide/nickel transport system substrate-binding protein